MFQETLKTFILWKPRVFFIGLMLASSALGQVLPGTTSGVLLRETGDVLSVQLESLAGTEDRRSLVVVAQHEKRQTCLDDTGVLDASSTLLQAFEGIVPDRTVLIAGNSIILDYSELSGAYRVACEEQSNGGVFHAINFDADCDASTGPPNRQHLTAIRFPRCYAQSCSDDFKVALFEEYTLRTTEDLNEERTDVAMTCMGSLTISDADTGSSENGSR